MDSNAERDLDTLLAATIRLLTLAIHDDDPNQLFTARRMLQSAERHPGLSAPAAATAVKKANELLSSHLARCIHSAGKASGGAGTYH